MKRRSEYQLKNPPSDTISSIKFHKKSDRLLLVSSWDDAIRLYDTDSNCVKFKWMTKVPMLDCSFMGSTHISYAGLDDKLYIRDADANIEETVGSHDSCIRCIEYVQKKNIIITGSWDKTIKLWDLRQMESIATREQSDGKVFAMSVVDEKIAVGVSERKALIWDMRNMKRYLILHRLNHPLGSIAISPNKQCYAIGNMDGRVAVEYINKDPEIRKCRAIFKCHRMYMNYSEYVYGVKAICFRNDSIFATGGTNGFVNIWDGVEKKRLCQYPRYSHCVSSLAFSPNGNKLAIACSDYNLEDRPTSETSITVRFFNERKMKATNLSD